MTKLASILHFLFCKYVYPIQRLLFFIYIYITCTFTFTLHLHLHLHYITFTFTLHLHLHYITFTFTLHLHYVYIYIIIFMYFLQNVFWLNTRTGLRYKRHILHAPKYD